jgi:glyoxylase-like metal-dependent hydrolase (beta-lactamase superfamily II)
MARATAIRVGAHEVEIVADGVAAYAVADVFPRLEPELAATLLQGRLNPDGSLPMPYHPLLVRTADGPILLDAGAGEELAAEWGAAIGRTEASLAATGLTPAEIALVLITHAHADHIGGLTAKRDGVRVPRYPNARHVMAAVEWDYWLEPGHGPAADDYLAGIARLHLLPLRQAGLLELTDGEAEVAPGVRIIPAPGHTPGHVAVEIESGAGELLALGDTVLHEEHFAHPDWTTEMDADPAQTVATRQRLLDRAGRRGSLIHGFHLAELGHVERAAAGYAFVGVGHAESPV